MKIPPQTSQEIIAGLLPRPQRLEPTAEDLRITDRTRILFTDDEAGRGRFAAERLAQMIADEFDRKLPVAPAEKTTGFHLWIMDGPDLPRPPAAADLPPDSNEAYAIEVNESGAVLTTASGRGLLWAAMTLRQLGARVGENLWFCGVRIQDAPQKAYRGFMLDSARAPNSPAKMKRIIRICSAFKLNFVIFREGDDELNAVRYAGNQLGAENPHALSLNDIQELIDYADHYGIMLVPEIESLGHSAAKGFQYPELIKGGFQQHYEGLGAHLRKAYLDPANPRSYELLESIYREWFPIIKGDLVHLGLDEVPAPMDLQKAHIERLLALALRIGAEHGRRIRPIIWSDAPPTPPAFIDKTIRCLWCYHEHYQHYGPVSLDNEMLIKQNIDQLVQADCRQAVFVAGGSGSGMPAHSKCPYEGAVRNLDAWARLARRYDHWTGILAVQWSGNMTDDWLPDFLTAADLGWQCPEAALDFDGHMTRISRQLARIPDAAEPDPRAMDRPAWDGVWLRDGEFHEDIMSARTVAPPA